MDGGCFHRWRPWCRPAPVPLCRIILSTAIIAWQKRSEPAVVPLKSGKTRRCFLAVYGSASPGRTQENPTRRIPPQQPVAKVPRGDAPRHRPRTEASRRSSIESKYERVSTTKGRGRGRKQRPRDFCHWLLSPDDLSERWAGWENPGRCADGIYCRIVAPSSFTAAATAIATDASTCSLVSVPVSSRNTSVTVTLFFPASSGLPR